MCGIAGFIDRTQSKQTTQLVQDINAMTQAIQYRGPDGTGHWVSAENGIALGHRRLAILDLTEAGFQPMVSTDQRFVLIYNGEIYNSPELQNQLVTQGYIFKGHSDTEVMLAAFCAWGIVEALKKMVGMFAFAVWDVQQKSLTLGRDRLGKKPLYYGWQDNTFVFASDLNAIRATSIAPGLKIDRRAMASFHQWAFIPSPYSMYQGIQKLKPGTVRTLTPADVQDQTLGTETLFWDLTSTVKHGLQQRSTYKDSFAAAVAQTEERLAHTVQSRMIADVPLGGFLSGGIDSSLVIALMQRYATKPVQTFAIGFAEQSYDESRYAEKVAHHLGTDHTSVIMTTSEALTIIQNLPTIYDEPFADSSAIPTVFVSQVAARSVKVVLSGDGGDEVFAGYTRYTLSQTVYSIFKWLPYRIRVLIAKVLRCIPVKVWTTLEPLTFMKHLANKIAKSIPVLQEQSFENVYERLLKRWTDEILFQHITPYLIPVENPFEHTASPVDWMQYHDTLHYLNDDILVKVDRATMAASLEARCPFLDHQLVEHAWRLPLKYKINQGKGKLILRKILGKYVPRELFERPKMGFGIPIDIWLRGPLKDWANSLLNRQTLEERGYHSAPILQQWQDHLSGKRACGDDLWMVLMAQLWENYWTKPIPSCEQR